MSRSATPATRNEATPHVKPPKASPFAELTIGTAIHRYEWLRTVAEVSGCEHKRNVERTHPQPPDPQSETGTLATHSGKTKYNVRVSNNDTYNVHGIRLIPHLDPFSLPSLDTL